MKKMALAAAVAALLPVVSVLAEDRFPDVEYTSGKAGFAQKIKGALVVDEKAVKFVNDKGSTVFELPIVSVTSASQSREKSEGSFGRKMALGVFASHDEEYLQVETKTTEAAEVIIFKTKKKMSPGMAAKINFFVEKSAKQ